MIEFLATSQTSTNFALAMNAALLAAPLHFESMPSPYEVQQVANTYSGFLESMFTVPDLEELSRQVIEVYQALARRQVHLGQEYEALLFNDIESLYEG